MYAIHHICFVIAMMSIIIARVCTEEEEERLFGKINVHYA